jgi:plastocyanin
MRFRKSAPPASSPSRPVPEAGRPGWGRILLVLLLAGLMLPRAVAGEVEGRVNLPPLPQQPEPVSNQRYEMPPRAGSTAPAPKPGIAYSGDRAAMPNPRVAVVYLEGNFPAPAEPPANARIEQKDQAFVPSFLVIRAGTSVEFPNLDDFFHNIYSNNPAKRFDLGRYRRNEPPPPVLFDKPGLITLRCDIHANMRALLLVVPTPYFVVTDKDGSYRLPALPAGKYKLKVWKDSNTTLEHEVVIPASGTLHIDFP